LTGLTYRWDITAYKLPAKLILIPSKHTKSEK
jgi:hypothetical protein